MIVETESGPVQGFTQEQLNYFLGIPYAAPPTGEYRWRAPRPAKRWDRRKPYDATYFKAECMQGKLHNVGTFTWLSLRRVWALVLLRWGGEGYLLDAEWFSCPLSRCDGLLLTPLRTCPSLCSSFHRSTQGHE